MTDAIVNKVANSGLITVDLEKFLPQGELAAFDLKDHLFMGLILKEKDFRETLKNMDWNIYQDKHVAVFCSADAVIPVWAFMLVANYLQPVARTVYPGTEDELKKHLILQNIHSIKAEEFRDQRVVIKGCGDIH